MADRDVRCTTYDVWCMMDDGRRTMGDGHNVKHLFPAQSSAYACHEKHKLGKQRMCSKPCHFLMIPDAIIYAKESNQRLQRQGLKKVQGFPKFRMHSLSQSYALQLYFFQNMTHPISKKRLSEFRQGSPNAKHSEIPDDMPSHSLNLMDAHSIPGLKMKEQKPTI